MTNDNQSTSLNKEQDFEARCLALLKRTMQTQDELGQQITNLEGQNAFVRQQIAQSVEIVTQQYSMLRESEAALRAELKKLQTGGPQRAMASIFYKLFRDLLKHMNQLDELVALGEDGEYGEAELAWVASLQALQGHFESILIDWGCTPIVIEENVEVFDPEFHEAVEAQEGEMPPSVPENVIVKVRQRGWKLQDHIVQYPRVVVS